jgi:hypothetical protein
MSKNVVEIDESQMTSQHGAYTLHAGLSKLYARMHMHTPTRWGTHVHARTHAQACTHRPIYNTYCFSTAKMISWMRLSVTSYVHCLPCFMWSRRLPSFDKSQIVMTQKRGIFMSNLTMHSDYYEYAPYNLETGASNFAHGVNLWDPYNRQDN